MEQYAALSRWKTKAYDTQVTFQRTYVELAADALGRGTEG